MNQVVLIGRLTRNPELKYIPSSGTAVTRFSMAVNREFKSEGQPDADFFNIVAWGKSAENCANYLVKGRLVAVNGSMRNNNYEDKNGVKHYNIEINANRVEFLEWGDKVQADTKPSSESQQTNTEDSFVGFQAIDGDDDIPF